MSNRDEHHETISSLGFYFKQEDLPLINAYQGHWVLTEPGNHHTASNYWVVTTDGEGHNVQGHMSPEEILDWADNRGWLPAYVAPYGQYVEGELDAIQLHEWLQRGRRERKYPHH